MTCWALGAIVASKMYSPIGEHGHGSRVEHFDGDGETVLELIMDDEERIVVAVPLVSERDGQSTVGEEHAVLQQVVSDLLRHLRLAPLLVGSV